MAKGLITQQHLEDIAEAIRGRNNSFTEYKPSEMAAAVSAIPNIYTAGDEGKVVKNSALIAQTARATEITENGTYDTTENNEVTVDVSGSSSVVQPLSVTQNGTYTPPSGVDGYAPVTVNVSGGGEDWVSLKNYIESSGTQYINSGYSPTANTKFEVIANASDNQIAYPALFGERTSTSNEVVIFTEYGNANVAMVFANGDSSVLQGNYERFHIGEKCKYMLSADGNISLHDTDNYGFSLRKAPGTFATLPIFIFVLNDNGTPNSVTYCSAKLYRFRIYEGDTLVHEYLPWQENGVACLKDTVTGNFLYNAGTGDFVYGTDT